MIITSLNDNEAVKMEIYYFSVHIHIQKSKFIYAWKFYEYICI